MKANHSKPAHPGVTGLSQRIIRLGQQWARREVSLASNGMELKASLVNRVTVIAVVALVLFAGTVAKRPM